jgi:hypothetical protein
MGHPEKLYKGLPLSKLFFSQQIRERFFVPGRFGALVRDYALRRRLAHTQARTPTRFLPDLQAGFLGADFLAKGHGQIYQ